MNNDLTVPRIEGINETAKIVGFPPYRIRQWALDGTIVAFRAGRRILINVDRLIDFLNSGKIETEKPEASAATCIAPINIRR